MVRQLCDVCEDIKAAEKKAILMIHGGKMPGNTTQTGEALPSFSGARSNFSRPAGGPLSSMSLMEEMASGLVMGDDGLGGDIDYEIALGYKNGGGGGRRRRRDEEERDEDEGPSYDAFDGDTSGGVVDEYVDNDAESGRGGGGGGGRFSYAAAASSSSDPKANALLARSIVLGRNSTISHVASKGTLSLINAVQGKFKAPRLAITSGGGIGGGGGGGGVSVLASAKTAASVSTAISGFVRASAVLKTKQGYTSSASATSSATKKMSPPPLAFAAASAALPIDVDAVLDRFEAMEKEEEKRKRETATATATERNLKELEQKKPKNSSIKKLMLVVKLRDGQRLAWQCMGPWPADRLSELASTRYTDSEATRLADEAKRVRCLSVYGVRRRMSEIYKAFLLLRSSASSSFRDAVEEKEEREGETKRNAER